MRLTSDMQSSSKVTMSKKLLCTALLLSMLALSSFAQSKPGLAYQLTYSVNDDPFPSPDGKRLVYDSVIEGKYQLFIMDVVGQNQRQITRDSANHETTSWASAGSK